MCAGMHSAKALKSGVCGMMMYGGDGLGSTEVNWRKLHSRTLHEILEPEMRSVYLDFSRGCKSQSEKFAFFEHVKCLHKLCCDQLRNKIPFSR